MIVLQRVGIVQPFFSPQFAQIEDEAKTTVPGGVVAVAYRSSGIGFGYNTKLVSKDQLPKTYQDLLNPNWKGKLAIVGSNTGAGWMGAIYHSYGEELLKKIAAQNYPVQMVSAMALAQIVATGEYAASPTLIDANVYVYKLKGAPVDWHPIEPVRVNIGQIAVAKNAQNPYAALLFTDFQISKDVGEIIRVRSYDSFRRDVKL
jgi:iron(III) transport system substrate-binding protein